MKLREMLEQEPLQEGKLGHLECAERNAFRTVNTAVDGGYQSFWARFPHDKTCVTIYSDKYQGYDSPNPVVKISKAGAVELIANQGELADLVESMYPGIPMPIDAFRTILKWLKKLTSEEPCLSQS